MPSRDHPPSPHQRALDLLRQALAISAEKRDAFVRSACAEDTALLNQVLALLAQQEMNTLAGASPSDTTPATSLPQRPADTRGRKLGRYTIQEVLGEGGMGTVYLAEQDSPRRSVALKVIRPGLLSKSILKRFEIESAVLGRLHHPGIAQIYEAGTGQFDGAEVPFFAMEHVRGVPLSDYAEQRRLDHRQRLALFALICDAVQHAHTKGVIHRDLKPGNILVEDIEHTSTDATLVTRIGDFSASRFGLTAQPKILDFGIARVTDSDVQQATMQTDVGQLVGTIPYMSPEQVAGDPNELDTRSDVYTLGVILYELLAHRLPHDVSKRTIPEAVRIIGTEPATRLSLVNKDLKGEIQTIVEKAIDKDKRRRYQSARDLADDIRRYLCDEPITAKPPSTVYKLSKFAKRNKGLVGGAIAATVVLALGVTGVSWQAARATAGWASAEKNLKIAQEETANAKAVSAFLTSMLSAVDPETAVGRDITARELLDAAVQSIDHSPPDAPQIEISIRGAVSQSYRGIGQAQKAVPQLRAAAALAEKSYGPNAELTIDARRNLALVLAETGALPDSEQLARENLERVRSTFGDDSIQTALVKGDLGRILQESGDTKEALTFLVAALPIATRERGPAHRDTLSIMNNLATAQKTLGNLNEAERLQRTVYQTHSKDLPPDHPQVLSASNNLATILQKLGRNREAAEMFETTLAGRERVLGADHTSTATTRLNAAVCLTADGQPEKAEPLIRQSLATFEAKLGPEHPKSIIAANSLAYTLEDLKKVDEAETIYRRLVEVRRRISSGGADPEMWGALNNLAMLLMNSGKLADAHTHFVELISICEKTMPAGHYAVAIFRSNFGECLTLEKKYEDAERELLASQEVLSAKLGPEHARTVKNAKRLAALYDAWGKTEQAATWKTKAP